MVKIRLARFGSKKRPYYHVVVTDVENSRDGKFIEQVGTYDPAKPMATASIDQSRIDYWTGVGAQVTTTLQKVLRELSLLQPPNGIAHSRPQAVTIAKQIGYPVLVRPSYVLGGRGMRVCNNQADLNDFLDEAFGATDRGDYVASAPPWRT